MEKKSNALTVILGLICAGLIAYIAFNKPMARPEMTAVKDTVTGKSAARAMHWNEGQTDNCGLPPEMLIDLIRNYKTEVWEKTSDVQAEEYDARFLEIGIDQLQEFIDKAKEAADADHKHIASVRMYYINYPGHKKTKEHLENSRTGDVFEDYSGCHSLAFVPVIGKDINDPERMDYYLAGQNCNEVATYGQLQQTADNKTLIIIPGVSYQCNARSLIANHNELCPPMLGCNAKTLLSIADN